MKLGSLDRFIFPGFLLAFEIIFLILFGLLVEYDTRGLPDQELVLAEELAERGEAVDFIRVLESSQSVIRTYPRECILVGYFFFYYRYLLLGHADVFCL